MSKHLPHAELERLAKLCGMLGSVHAGERASAAAKADQLVRSRGLTWRQVLLPTPLISSAATAASLSIREKIELCQRHVSSLTPSERKFVLSLHRFQHLSEKQLRVLDRLAVALGDEQQAA